jgi:uncharacterized membrane protein
MMNPKKLGILMLLGNVIVLSLILLMKAEINSQQLKTCEGICANNEAGSCDISSCPFQQENQAVWMLDAAGLFLAILAGVSIYIIFSKDVKTMEAKEYDLSKMSDEERGIFLFVKAKKGVYQSDIVKEFNISKVKVTRILDSLSKKELIERKRTPTTNLIELK